MMDIFIAIIIALLIFGFIEDFRLRKKQENLLQQQTFKRNGKLISGGFFTDPKLTLNHSGYNIIIYSKYRRWGGEHHIPPSNTYAKISFKFLHHVKSELSKKAKLEIWPSREFKQRGYTDLNNAFIIKGKEESFVRRLLTPEVQKKLLSLKREPHLHITHFELVLCTNGIEETEDYDNFIDTALLLFERLLTIEENLKSAETYYNQGNTYKNKGQYDQAISDYNRAIEINPKYVGAYHNRGIAYFHKGKYDKAWDDVSKVQNLGQQVHPGFLKALREASERQR